MNVQQTRLLQQASLTVNSELVKNQLNMNIICSFVFTIFIGLLFIFVIKSFF
jgi:capsular polysaccharide biosynthesis protein